MSLKTSKVLFVDCQTTGASPKSSHLLELAWGIGSSSEEVAVSSLVVLPPDGVEIPKRILQLTGISPEELAGGHQSREVRARFSASLSANSEVAYGIAHFARIEEDFVGRLWRAHGNEPAFPLRFICLHKVARRLFPDFTSYGLRALVGYFGQPLHELKRAGPHVQATTNLWKAVVGELERIGIAEWNDFLSWLEGPIAKKPKRNVYRIADSARLALPEQPGVYQFINKTGSVLYVGKASSLKGRVNSYFRGKKGPGSRKKEMLMQAWDLNVKATATPLEAALLEYDEIQTLDPPYNIIHRATSRSMAFCDRELTEFSSTNDERHDYGPFFVPEGFHELTVLRDFVSTEVFRPDPLVFYGLEDSEILSSGLNLFCQKAQIDRQDFLRPRTILNFGFKLLRLQVETLLASDDDDDDDHSVEDEDDHEETEIVWTPDLVASQIPKILMRSTRRWLISRWLTRLSEATIMFAEPERPGVKGRRQVTIGSGRVVRIDQESDQEVPPTWKRSINDRHKTLGFGESQRLMILLQELRRIAKAGGEVVITFGPRLKITTAEFGRLSRLGFARL